VTPRISRRRSPSRIAARTLVSASAILLAGCFATTKHVASVEESLTRRSAWTDEKIGELGTEISQVRAENDALRLRMDDLSDRMTGLGGEVAGRLSELEQADARLTSEARQATVRAAEVGATRDQDREELLSRMNVILDEVVQENKRLRQRIEALEAAGTAAGAYVVQSGDTVASIAAKFGTTSAAIVQANGLADADHIRVGQELVIPGR